MPPAPATVPDPNIARPPIDPAVGAFFSRLYIPHRHVFQAIFDGERITDRQPGVGLDQIGVVDTARLSAYDFNNFHLRFSLEGRDRHCRDMQFLFKPVDTTGISLGYLSLLSLREGELPLPNEPFGNLGTQCFYRRSPRYLTSTYDQVNADIDAALKEYADSIGQTSEEVRSAIETHHYGRVCIGSPNTEREAHEEALAEIFRPIAASLFAMGYNAADLFS